MSGHSKHTLRFKQAAYLGVGLDLNHLAESGLFEVIDPINGPTTGCFFILSFTSAQDTPTTNSRIQHAWRALNGIAYTRVLVNDVWSSWDLSSDGAPGEDGEDGAPGVDGDDGAPGVDGDDGAAGSNGTNGAGYLATSTTSLVTAGSGSKVFTTQTGLAYTVGARIRATSVGTADWMEGVVTGYTGSTLTVAMDLNSGTGTNADWNINLAGQRGAVGPQGPATNHIIVAASDETTVIPTGTNKVTFRMPYAFTLTGVRASLKTACASGTFTVDINEGGASILSTKLTFDATEKTTATASVPAVISDSVLGDDAEITIDVDDGADGNAVGLKITLLGYAT